MPVIELEEITPFSKDFLKNVVLWKKLRIEGE